MALDGLETKLVERWNVKVYKQKYRGSLEVTAALRSGDPVYTPLIWASFLLGEPAYKYGFTLERIAEERSKAGYGPLRPLFMLRMKLFGKRQLGLRPLLRWLGLYDGRRVVEKAGQIETLPHIARSRTVVEEARNLGFRVWIKDFPGYNDEYYAKVRATFSKYFDLSLAKRKEKVQELYEYARNALKEAAEAAREYDLTIYYTDLLDIANHMFYRPKKPKAMVTLAAYYKMMANEIRSAVVSLKNTATLIVSDHGYDPRIHDHSMSGFWSCNIKPYAVPRTIMDLKGIILKWLATK